jgi:hypothetical protein
MNRRALVFSATSLAAALPLAAFGARAGWAQENTAAGGGGGEAAAGGGGGSGGGEAGGQSATAQAPVAYVTSVAAERLTYAPKDVLVRVQGLVSTINWGAGVLVPLVRGVPSDGMLDLELVATAPNGTQFPSKFYPVDADLKLPADNPYKGVRVRGAFNAVTLKAMPGIEQNTTEFPDLTKIVGMTYVPKGGSGSGAGMIKAEELPPNTKVIGPNDGMNDQTRDPNRLTLFIAADGKVLDAYWN